MILCLIFKKSFFFLFSKQMFSIFVYVRYVFLRLIRVILHIEILKKFMNFFFNFDFVFVLIFANEYRIELIIFYIFNQNCDFAYRDWFSILFFIYYQILLIRENDVNYVLTFSKYKCLFSQFTSRLCFFNQNNFNITSWVIISMTSKRFFSWCC